MSIITTVETYGFGSVFDRIETHKRNMSPERRTRAAVAGAKLAKVLLTADMKVPKSGIQWPNLPRRSSSPAETPAYQSGDMASMMRVNSIGDGVAELEAYSREAWFMEFGFMTRDGSFHIRPWMAPGVQMHRGEIRAAMKAEMRR